MVEAYVAIDLETTGLSPKEDRILEIGAVRVRKGKIEESFSSLIHPRRKITEQIVALTGITEEMVEDAPVIQDVIGRVLEFCGDLPLLGHNVIFDYSFLKQAAVNSGLAFEKDGIDTLKLCRKFMPEEEKKNLSAACAWYQVENVNAHRALSDACAAHKLYEELKKRHCSENEEAFSAYPLQYHTKRVQPATKRQKEYLRDLIKYHKIALALQIDDLSRSEASRMVDKIISQYGRKSERGKEVKENDQF